MRHTLSRIRRVRIGEWGEGKTRREGKIEIRSPRGIFIEGLKWDLCDFCRKVKKAYKMFLGRVLRGI